MVAAFIVAVVFTLGGSFVCSMLEALILSTTVAEIEALKRDKPRKGDLLEKLRTNLGDTIAAILSLNTIANTAGSAVVGGLAGAIWGSGFLAFITAALTFGILLFSEIIPKNLGVIHRVRLQPWVVRPLAILVYVFRPLTVLTNLSVKLVLRESEQAEDSNSNEEEIILLAEKGAKEGTLTSSESNMVANALKLDEVLVSEIMTPRVVVTSFEEDTSIEQIFQQHPNIEFARIPVYDEEIDNIVGMVRRRDLLRHKAEGDDQLKIREIMDDVKFVPETVTVAAALQLALKSHQQLLVVVDEFGSMAGVVTMEDIMECILGREIFEKDDKAIDMRELARAESLKAIQSIRERDTGKASRAAPAGAKGASASPPRAS